MLPTPRYTHTVQRIESHLENMNKYNEGRWRAHSEGGQEPCARILIVRAKTIVKRERENKKSFVRVNPFLSPSLSSSFYPWLRLLCSFQGFGA